MKKTILYILGIMMLGLSWALVKVHLIPKARRAEVEKLWAEYQVKYPS